jgi:hypothetical protein
VRRLVVEGLARSAIIAHQARPRDRTDEDNGLLDPSMTIPAEGLPPWGDISHPGWTAPDCPDLPSQEFEPVIEELPHLIEAKAVSLAPVNPPWVTPDPQSDSFRSHSDFEEPPTADERVVELLQRPSNMCLRDYLSHLMRLNLINPPQLGPSFLSLYERARFSDHRLTEREFRSMMGMFAELLRGMTAIDPEIVADLQADDVEGAGSSISGQSSEGQAVDTFNSSESRPSVRRSRSGPCRHHPPNSPNNGSFRVSNLGARQISRGFARARTPSTISLQPIVTGQSGSSGGSVVWHARSPISMNAPDFIDVAGRNQAPSMSE